MNLNDPFNRLSKQDSNEYSKFRQSLIDSSINTRQDAEALLKNIQQRALLFSILTAVVAAITGMFLPKFKVIVIVFALLILLWLFTITFKGQRFMRRYIKEEFSRDP